MSTTGFAGTALAFTWREPDLAWVTFARGPAMNTITLEFLDELSRALDLAEAGGARALVLAAEGRAFCGGAHLTYFTAADSPVPRDPQGLRDRYVARIARLFDRLEGIAIPTIAMIGGYALGGGCELAIACDLRVVSHEARIGVPEVRVGVLPGAGGAHKLGRIVGRGRALEMVLLGRQLGGEDALAWGLANACVATEALEARTLEIVAAIRQGGPLALAYAKASVYRSEDIDLATARETVLDAVTILAGSAEFAEGTAAFAEKRPPRWPEQRRPTP